MHIKNDICERITVAAVGLIFTTAIVWCCVRSSHKDSSDLETVAAEEVTDDFQGEFLQPQVPTLTTSSPNSPIASSPKGHLVEYNGRYFSPGKAFADRNDKHLSAAEKIGLHPGPNNREAAAKMHKQLREIHTNSNYVVEDLTHSLPYLVPIAANRLDSIGEEFADILSRNNLPKYRFRVTSVLRSGEDIRRLNRCNSNSIANSPHNYGTTFDIGYAHFDKVTNTLDSMTDDNLKLVLSQTLLNQQRAGHIYVKYEHKQGCFHITARN